jgi:hypothetical protein
MRRAAHRRVGAHRRNRRYSCIHLSMRASAAPACGNLPSAGAPLPRLRDSANILGTSPREIPTCLGAGRYWVTVIVACIDAWIVQVMGKVPGFAKTTVFRSPGENDCPFAEANSLGAPLTAVKVPPCPVTRL